MVDVQEKEQKEWKIYIFNNYRAKKIILKGEY